MKQIILPTKVGTYFSYLLEKEKDIRAKQNNFTESIKLSHHDFESSYTVGSQLKYGYN